MKKQYKNCYEATLDFIVITQELNSIYTKLDKSSEDNEDLIRGLSIKASRLEDRFYLLKHSLQKLKIAEGTALDLAIQLNNIDKEYLKNAEQWNKEVELKVENQVYTNHKAALLENIFYEVKEQLERYAFLYDYSWSSIA